MEYGIFSKCLKYGTDLAKSTFGFSSSQRLNSGLKKRLNAFEIKDMASQSHCLGSMETCQILLTLAKEIGSMSGEDQDKFELLIGEIEVVYAETVNGFANKWGGPDMPRASVEKIKEMVKGWKVEIRENVQETHH